MIGHHLHSPVQIIKAVRLDLPTLVTIREPADAVVSLTSRWPYISLHQALRSYVRFYEKIEPYQSGYVLSPFDQTTRHLDDVIRAVNRRFGTAFHPFEHSEENMRTLRDPKVLSSDEERGRRAIKAQKTQALDRKVYQSLLAEAKTLYCRLLTHGVLPVE